MIQFSVLFIILHFIHNSVSENVREVLFTNGPCMKYQYRCLNNKCIPRSHLCNNVNDCGDNSDEAYCMTYESCPVKYPYISCLHDGSPFGGRSRTCIPETWKCDGITDCEFGSDETECDLNEYLSPEVTSFQVSKSARKARDWILKRRNTERFTRKWGSDLPRTAVALFLSNNYNLKESNNVTSEIAYELSIDFLSKIALKKIEGVSTSELASYVNAFLVTCINPRKFYGLDLVEKLRKRLNALSTISPFALLALCNAQDIITARDTQKLRDVFQKAHEQHRTDTQAMVVLALSCASGQSDDLFTKEELSDLTMMLKQQQYRNGSVENLKTTSLVMQALFASEHEPDDDNFDEKKAIQQIIYSQKEDGSFGDIVNTYYALPVLGYLSLVNISSAYCPQIEKNENEALEYLKNQVGVKWNVRFSIWIAEDKILKRTLTLSVPANTSFYSIMEYAADLDVKYKFEYNVRGRKPYIFALSGLMDDPEMEKFWFPYYLTNETAGELKPINESPADVIPQDNDHLVFWYKTEAETKPQGK